MTDRWPELANRVVFDGRMFTVHGILGGEYLLSGINRDETKRVRRDLLEHPDECWCAECDSYAPEDERMAHPKDPENAWIHTTCAAHLQRERDAEEVAEHQAKKAEEEKRKRAGKLHPWCRSRPWRGGDTVLVPMRVVGGTDRAFGEHCILVEPGPGQRVDQFGSKHESVLVLARSVYPDHLAGLTDEALGSLADALVGELVERGIACDVGALLGHVCRCGGYHPGGSL